MHKLFSLKKKGATDIVPTELIGIILGVMIVLGLIFLGAKLAGLLISKQEYDATVNNFDVLVKRINNLIDDDRNFISSTLTYSISDEHILVGFSYKDEGKMHTECTDEDIFFSRPVLCKDFSCLCIYENTFRYDFDSDIEDANTLRCNKFDEKIVFLAPADEEKRGFQGSRSSWSNQHPIEAEYEYLVLYGNNCDLNIWTGFNVQQLYVEKIKENDNIFVYISDYSEAQKDKFDKRKDIYEKQE